MSQENTESKKNQAKQPSEKQKGMVEQNFERYDERWSFANQARDWLILFVIAAIWVIWMVIVYVLEPGIR